MGRYTLERYPSSGQTRDARLERDRPELHLSRLE